MSHIAVFCRSNHPHGYGGFSYYAYPFQGATDQIVADAARANDDERWRYTAAHGYVTLIVHCDDDIELKAVEEQLRSQFFYWDTRKDAWYGGMFELVWSAEYFGPPRRGRKMSMGIPFSLGEYASYGDNRACAYLTAKEILNADARTT